MATTDLSQFDEMTANITMATQPMLKMLVKDHATEVEAQGARSQIAALKKQVDERVRERLAPIEAELERVKAAAKRLKEALDLPEKYLLNQLNARAQEVARARNEALRIQREKEEAVRKEAQEKARAAAEALRAKQEQERRDREAAQAEADRKAAAERQAAQAAADEAAAKRDRTAKLFGGAGKSQSAIEAERRRQVEELEANERAARAKQEEEDRRFAAEQERARLAEEARIQRENEEAQRQAEAERGRLAELSVKGARTEPVVTVIDAWAVPRELCNPPQVLLSEVKKAWRAGRKDIPGVSIKEEERVARSPSALSTMAPAELK